MKDSDTFRRNAVNCMQMAEGARDDAAFKRFKRMEAAWLALAAVSTVFTPIQARVGMSFPRQLAGRGLTAYNLVLFVSIFIVQSGLGVMMDWLIGRGMNQQDAFRASLGGIALMQVAVWLVFVSWPTRAPIVTPAAR